MIDFYEKTLDCVHCGLCLDACPTYDQLGTEHQSPRGRIYLMRALAEGRIQNIEKTRSSFDNCLGCRACESACPSGVQYGALIESVRDHVEQISPAKGLAAHLRRFLLKHIVPHRRRLRFTFDILALAEGLGLRKLAATLRILPPSVDRVAPHVPARKERGALTGTYRTKGDRRGQVHMFTGCVMEQVFGNINRATVELLTANGYDVIVPETQVCCGALLLHDGHAKSARGLAKKNLKAFDGAEIIINNSAGCGAALREYGELLGSSAAEAFAKKNRDICEFLADVGLTATPRPFPHKVTYDAPCHLCHGQGVRTQPLDLLRQVPEIQLVDNPGQEDCCGSAGIYNLLHPELAEPIGQNKATGISTGGSDHVATGNPGCMMQIQAHLDGIGSQVKTLHPVELLLPDRPPE